MAATIAVVAGYFGLQNRRDREPWRALAARLDLRVGTGWRLDGTFKGWTVKIRSQGDGHEQTTTITVHAKYLLLRGVALSAEPSGLRGLFTEADPTVGDPEFDAQVRIEGVGSTAALAMLDHRARALLLPAVREGLTVTPNAVVFTGGRREVMVQRIPALLESMVVLVDALALDEAQIPARLARNATTDPLPAVRLANLRALLGDFEDHPATLEAARAILSDGPDEARMLAARRLGGEAVEACLALAADAANLHLRAAALDHALCHGTPAALADALDRFGAPSAPAALRAVVAHHAARTGLTSRVLALLQDPEGLPGDALAALVEAAAPLGTAAEPALLALVEHPAEPVRLALVERLRSLEGPEALAALRQLAGGLSPFSAVRRAAQAAVAAREATHGDKLGALSVAREDRGTLAMTEREP
ncbi:MAG: hypothetical protein H6702_18355 [Myxococcales bacterium]|nr:hypothetical protein [Myxococcales bacterium]